MLIASRILICEGIFVNDAAGIVLYNILKNPVEAVDIWPKIKIHFFEKEHLPIYVAISKYYNKYNSLPSFSDLILTTREENLLTRLYILKDSDVPEDLDPNIAVDALIDEFTQREVLDKISIFVDKVLTYDTSEIKENISKILLDLDEKTQNSEQIYGMNEIYLIDKEEEHKRIPLGINNTLDAKNMGVALTELIMFGGYRGSGKSNIACNIADNQIEQGNSCLYFSIEMRYREVFNRMLSIRTGIPNNLLLKNQCSKDDYIKIANARRSYFEDTDDIFNKFLHHEDYEKFEIDLLRTKELKKNNQLIIVDNQFLTPTEIDLTIQKYKTKYEDNLKLVIVDYVNQINVPDIYDWKTQILLSKHLKNMARKHDVVLVTPYQTDKQGEARLSKGILDAADIAANLTAFKEEDGSGYINIKSTKTRNISNFEINCPMNWNTLKISPEDAIIESTSESTEEKTQNKKEKAKDIPF